MKNYFTLLILLFSSLVGLSQTKSFRTNLYIVPPDGSPAVLMDGTLTFFDNAYSNAVDNKDARKMFNPGENWGMARDPYTLIVERRQDIALDDTIFFKMWNTRIITYRIELVPKYFDVRTMSAFLVDKYLKTEKPISLTETSFVDFEVTSDANSKRQDRFMLIFDNRPAGAVMPLKFISAHANYNKNTVAVNWQTANEQNVKEFQVEKSTNGTQFNSTGLIASAHNTPSATYSLTDNQPYAGANYYRIKSTDKDGRINYSDVMKVMATNIQASISLFPNPSTTANIRLRFSGQQSGTYHIRLVNSNGNLMHTQNEVLTSAGTDINLNVHKTLPAGIYLVDISGPDGFHNVQNLLIRH